MSIVRIDLFVSLRWGTSHNCIFVFRECCILATSWNPLMIVCCLADPNRSGPLCGLDFLVLSGLGTVFASQVLFVQSFVVYGFWFGPVQAFKQQFQSWFFASWSLPLGLKPQITFSYLLTNFLRLPPNSSLSISVESSSMSFRGQCPTSNKALPCNLM